MQVYRTPYKQPWKNGRIERFFRTIKNEVFSRVEIKDVAHANRLCAKYQEHYDLMRPHQALNGSTPGEENRIVESVHKFRFKKVKTVGGLITKFELAA